MQETTENSKENAVKNKKQSSQQNKKLSAHLLILNESIPYLNC